MALGPPREAAKGEKKRVTSDFKMGPSARLGAEARPCAGLNVGTAVLRIHRGEEPPEARLELERKQLPQREIEDAAAQPLRRDHKNKRGEQHGEMPCETFAVVTTWVTELDIRTTK